MANVLKNLPIKKVKDFWEKNPLCSAAIKDIPGTKEFFIKYDFLREITEPTLVARKIYEYCSYRGKKVLEVGCGNSYTLSKYAQEGSEVYGIDITETAITISKDRFNYLGLKGNFTIGNAESLPYEDNYFDLICSMGVLHHVPDTVKAINEIHRCLKPGGKIIIMLYYSDSLTYRVIMPIKSVFSGKNRQQLINEVDGIGNPKGDIYSKKEMKQLLSNFENLNLFINSLRPMILLRILPSRVAYLLGKKWGWFLYAKGNKRGIII